MDIFYTITYALVGTSVFLGMLVMGLALGRLILEKARKMEAPWQVQVTVLAGFFAFLIALAFYVHTALAGFGLGFGGAILAWGFPKKKESDE